MESRESIKDALGFGSNLSRLLPHLMDIVRPLEIGVIVGLNTAPLQPTQCGTHSATFLVSTSFQLLNNYLV